MIEAKGYSIWLEPEGEVKNDLSKVIRDLSAQYNTPLFYPHVTLLGGIVLREEEVVDRTKEIARNISPYTVAVTGTVDCEDHWTKALFLVVSETVEIMAANRVARTVCGMEGEGYHPHLSLMYTEDIPIDQRRKIASGLDPEALKGQFLVDKLHLYRTEGGVESWVKVGEFKLTGN